jgi:membrane protease YdiL (CAAX protease family)
MLSLIEYFFLTLLQFLYVYVNFYCVCLSGELYDIVHPVYLSKRSTLDTLIYIQKITVVEEYIFRVLLLEIINYFLLSFCDITMLSSIIFSLAHVSNHLHNYGTIQIKILIGTNQMIFTFILGYFYLFKTNYLGSLLIHSYNNLICIGLQHYFHNKKELNDLTSKKILISNKIIKQNVKQ